MEQPFQLAACAEMLWRDRPIEWRAARLTEMGFGVGLWNWPAHDLQKLEAVGADYTIMNGYLQGRLSDPEGAETLLRSARETVQIGKRLGVSRLNLHGTGLGEGGLPIPHNGAFAPGMVERARDTLHRICDLAEAEGVQFVLENLNPFDHPGCPFGSTSEVLALVSSVDRPELRINLDLYHTQIGEGDLIRWCEACLPWIGEIQVADNPGRFEPGTGEINFAGVARALQRMGYRGPVAMEAFAQGNEEAALAAFRAAFTL
ncbi:hydroxypyruvate isomerase [Thioclava dalianensis]|uniref:Hydroxypyruvate isomerase n=1 Tax=Thioclava dalianensis TaxID=1185766 RepID=A0A074U3V4_9RHOB|nr:TIM barrel protein [Thioclava dalianensis]KEP69307.1 hydroxypyruvate isomerase [Thioclava dalianensis]SFN56345.1 hydroxypyruvate isomerase [Thioclava dalianensis]